MPKVIVRSTDAIAGALGGQTWGQVGVAGTSWSGAAALVSSSGNGIAVAGGRHQSEIDYNPATGTSESLRVSFAQSVDVATFRLSFLSPNVGGSAEVAGWRAYGASGALVAQGVVDPRGLTALSPETYEFSINPTAAFRSVELFARPYNNVGTTGGADSSDFALAELRYVTLDDVAPVAVGAATSLAGGLGSQSWGGLSVSATSWSGVAALVTKNAQGLGISGGRNADQIDYNPPTGSSETLKLNFASGVDQATLRIGRLFSNEGGNSEVATWRAYDAAGSQIAQGIVDSRTATAVSANTFDVAINAVQDVRRIELSARPHSGAGATGPGPDSSDFSLVQVTYLAGTGDPLSPPVPSPPPPAPPPPPPASSVVGMVIIDGGSTSVAEGGGVDIVTLALSRPPTADVTFTFVDTADLDFGAPGQPASSSTTLTFTSQNWATAQSLSVAARTDTVREAAEVQTILFDPVSADSRYAALASQTVSVAVAADPPAPTSGAPAGAIIVEVGDNIQALVSAAPTGAVFWIEAGEHRLQSIVPKTGQTFLGEEGALLNGSRQLSGFEQNGSTWSVGGQTQEGARRATGEAAPGAERGGYPDAIYFDDRPLRPVDSLAEVRSGTYYFDYGADRIHIGDNPTGHSVEAAVSAAAFSGGASGVTIRNLIVEKYASPTQFGAIGGVNPGSNWVIDGNEVRLNYGVGIIATSGSRVTDNDVHDNGQMGVGANGRAALFENNEIYRNGFWSGIDVYWEGGGSKFGGSTDLVARGNYIHNNNGNGLWSDEFAVDTVFENNRLERNSAAGITMEISYGGIVRNNTAINNGFGFNDWLWGAGIQIQNTQGVEVYGNTVDMTDGGNGITLVQQDRVAGPLGPVVTEDNYVHDNVIISRRDDQGVSGALADYNLSAMLAGNNRFDFNEYRVTNANNEHWAWGDYATWSEYRANSGWDANGTLTLL